MKQEQQQYCLPFWLNAASMFYDGKDPLGVKVAEVYLTLVMGAMFSPILLTAAAIDGLTLSERGVKKLAKHIKNKMEHSDDDNSIHNNIKDGMNTKSKTHSHHFFHHHKKTTASHDEIEVSKTITPRY